MEKTIDRIDDAVKNLKATFNIANVPRVLIDLVLDKKIRNERVEEKARNAFEGITSDDLIREIVKHALKVAVSQENIPCNDFCKLFLKQIKDNDISPDKVIEYLRRHEFLLCKLTVAFALHRYEEKIDLEKLENVTDKEVKKYIYYLDKTNKENTKTSSLGKVRNLLFNKSKKDIILNAQCKKGHIDYQVGDLCATIEKGKKENQEDRVILLEHPNNSEFKLMATADANENRFSKDSPSNYAILSLMKWFEELDPSFFEDIDSLANLLDNKLRQINIDMVDNKKGETSLACVIVGKDKTLVSTIGSSRVYKEKDGKTEKVNKENTLVQDLITEGYIKEEFSRFHKASNVVLRELGRDEVTLDIGNRTSVIDNDYDKILIVTYGVVKGLEEKKIIELLDHRTPTTSLTKIATNSHSVLEDLKYGYEREIPSGEYNATAALYVKKKEKVLYPKSFTVNMKSLNC